MPRALSRLPFTAATLVVLGLVASLTDTYRAGLARRFLRTWGWAPADFAFGELYRIVSSALVTQGGVVFWVAAGMVAGMVGTAEWRHGSLRTGVAFWLGHAATLTIMAVLAYLHGVIDPAGADLWAQVRDVGPSAGAFACLGAVIVRLRRSRGLPLAVGLTGVLLLDAFAWSGIPRAETSADVAHLIAFPLGLLSGVVGWPGRWLGSASTPGGEHQRRHAPTEAGDP